jgi:hypothetical protein
MLSLSYQFIISVIVLNAIIYFLLASRAKKQGIVNAYGLGIFFLVSVLTVILHTVIYFGLIFMQFNKKIANTYSEHPIGKNIFVLIKPSKLYADKGAPDYVGAEMTNMSLQIGDTVQSSASYQQGDFVSGKDFSKIVYKDKVCWFIADDVTQSYFYYTYEHQPLSFEASPEQNKLYWKRAEFYMKSYQKYNQDRDLDEPVYNDTLMNVRWNNSSFGGHLNIKRKVKVDTYVYEIHGGNGKAQEYCIMKDVKDRFGNAPFNQNAFAYYVTHGDFYQDPYRSK